MHWGNHWGMHMYWWIFWLAGASALVFWSWPTPTKRRRGAFETLRRSYAGGEITEDEYRHRLAVLRESKQPGEVVADEVRRRG